MWNLTGSSLWTFLAATEHDRDSTFTARNRDVIAILIFAALIRAAVFLLSDNEPGDADARVIISFRWAHNPTLIRTGVWLPFHFYATGILTWVFGNPITAGKVLSFVLGSLSVIPLFLLTQILFDRRTAVIAGLMFGVYGLHVELSSVVMSEVPCAFFLLWALYLFVRESRSQSPRFAVFAAAAALLAVAGGFRQEPWLFTGILSIYMLLTPALRRYAIGFGLIGFSTFFLWDLANAAAGQGDLHALVAVANAKEHAYQVIKFGVVHNLLKWPGIFVCSPGPVVSALAAVGLVMAFRRRLPSDLAWIAVMSVAPFVVLSIVKPAWAPQARYAVFFGILILPYAAAATTRVLPRPDFLGATLVGIIVASIIAQGTWYFWRNHVPLPTHQYNANDVSCWNWLRANAKIFSSIVVEDTEWRAPGLIAHSALYDRPFRIVYTVRGPGELQDAITSSSRPLLLVVHSPSSQLEFLEGLRPRVVFQNPDYRILVVDRALAANARVVRARGSRRLG